MQLPEGVSLIATDSQRTIGPLKIGERRRILFPLKVSKPVEGTISLNLIAREAGKFEGFPVEFPLSVLPSLNLPKADYVPEPKPLKSEYEIYDVEKRFTIEPGPAIEPQGCICGSILRGVSTPLECKLFRKTCTPENPVGPCMVSSEGSCASYFHYQGE